MSDLLSENGTPSESIHSSVAQNLARDKAGHFIKKVKELSKPSLVSTDTTTSSSDPALVSLKVTNPVTYFKLWWKKVMGNEGVDFRFRVRPLTAIAIVFIIASGSFGVGLLVQLASKTPVVQYIPAFAASPTPDPWREAAFSGLLRETGGIYYLITTDAEAIRLSVPVNLSLSKYVGKRIFATGRYNRETEMIEVLNASDLEVLPLSPSVAPTKF